MTLRDYQNLFVNEFALFDEWSDKFNLLIEYSDSQPKNVPEDLLEYRISNCQSRTYFRASLIDGYIHVSGWSNSSIMAGLIVCMKRMFNDFPMRELAETGIYFHTGSGLVDHITPMRRAALLEMIDRLNVLSTGKV